MQLQLLEFFSQRHQKYALKTGQHLQQWCLENWTTTSRGMKLHPYEKDFLFTESTSNKGLISKYIKSSRRFISKAK